MELKELKATLRNYAYRYGQPRGGDFLVFGNESTRPSYGLGSVSFGVPLLSFTPQCLLFLIWLAFR